MKSLDLFVKILLIASIVYLSSCCSSDLHGDYYFDDLARSYILDTIHSFTMIDNQGFKESFYTSNEGEAYSFYNGGDLDRCGVQYRIQDFYLGYTSTINRYSFVYGVRAAVDENGPVVSVSWYQDTTGFSFSLYPKTGQIFSLDNEDDIVQVSYIHTMTVRGKEYNKVMVVKAVNGAQTWTLYIARPEGLIKFVRPDGIYAERLQVR